MLLVHPIRPTFGKAAWGKARRQLNPHIQSMKADADTFDPPLVITIHEVIPKDRPGRHHFDE